MTQAIIKKTLLILLHIGLLFTFMTFVLLMFVPFSRESSLTLFLIYYFLYFGHIYILFYSIVVPFKNSTALKRIILCFFLYVSYFLLIVFTFIIHVMLYGFFDGEIFD